MLPLKLFIECQSIIHMLFRKFTKKYGKKFQIQPKNKVGIQRLILEQTPVRVIFKKDSFLKKLYLSE